MEEKWDLDMGEAFGRSREGLLCVDEGIGRINRQLYLQGQDVWGVGDQAVDIINDRGGRGGRGVGIGRFETEL